ncbi:YcfL family protein [Propionivibrio limicola]|uniref:YcfL family protein n=1 Tax=Propionivibrio limicola TaxID=167645 RepID=UPI0012926C43|nr:YcfL family protein [Propionivibrio limicola]
MKRHLYSLGILLATSVHAFAQAPEMAPSPGPSIASKLEEQGKMDYLQVTDLRATKRDNLLRIQAEITNTHAGNQQLYYRFKWLDRDGFSVWDEEPWKPMTLYGNQKQFINAIAPTFKAADFRLLLQSPNNTAN